MANRSVPADPLNRSSGSCLQRASGLWVCSLAFFAWRFSLSDLPDFFEAVLRGDLSDMSASFPYSDRTPLFTSPERTQTGLWPTPGRPRDGGRPHGAGGCFFATGQVGWGMDR